MPVSDGHGQRQNIEYLIGFIVTRDGRAEGTIFDINTLTAHTRRRPGAGQILHFPGVLLAEALAPGFGGVPFEAPKLI